MHYHINSLKVGSLTIYESLSVGDLFIQQHQHVNSIPNHPTIYEKTGVTHDRMGETATSLNHSIIFVNPGDQVYPVELTQGCEYE